MKEIFFLLTHFLFHSTNRQFSIRFFLFLIYLFRYSSSIFSIFRSIIRYSFIFFYIHIGSSIFGWMFCYFGVYISLTLDIISGQFRFRYNLWLGGVYRQYGFISIIAPLCIQVRKMFDSIKCYGCRARELIYLHSNNNS